jgi:hypothetical protein
MNDSGDPEAHRLHTGRVLEGKWVGARKLPQAWFIRKETAPLIELPDCHPTWLNSMWV